METRALAPPPAAKAAVPRPDNGSDVVIVTEQVGEFGGTERVLEALLDGYPRARALAPRFGPSDDDPRWDRVEEVARGSRRRHYLAPRYARWMAAATLGPARVVVSLSHNGWGTAVNVPAGARHISYCAGLPRALYGFTDYYLAEYPRAVRPVLRATVPVLKRHNRRMMLRPDRLLANSDCSADSLAAVLGRKPEVIHPPVATDFFTPPVFDKREHFLVVARLRPQKRVDVVVDAFRGIDAPLVVAGEGPLLEPLRNGASSNVTFAGYVSDEELLRLYRQSHAVICPSVEDFGLVMAEAHATATPVIAPRAGGALEIVSDHTGVLVDRVDEAGLRKAVRQVMLGRFDRSALRASAGRFSVDNFLAQIDAIIDEEREGATVPITRSARSSGA